MSVRKSISWAFAGQFASFAAMFGGSVAVARLLSPHELGIYAVAAATYGIIQVITTFGVSAYVIRDSELRPETLDAAFTANAILSLAIAGIVFAASFAGKTLLGDAAAGNALRLLAVGPLTSIVGFRPAVMCQREMRFKAAALIGSSCVIFATAVTVASAFWGQSYMSPAYGSIAAGFYTAIAYNIVAHRHNSFRVSFAGWGAMTVFGMRMISVTAVGMIAGRISEIMLGRFLGLAALGFYSRASNLSNMIYENFYGTATRVVFPQLAKDFRERGDLRTTFMRGLQMITAVMWPLLAGLAILSRPAIHILYGDKWMAAALPLSCLMLMQIVTLLYGMNWELFVLRDETKTQSRYEIIRSVIGLGLFAIGCQIGLAAAALARALDASIGAILYLPHIRRLADLPRGELPRAYGQSFLLTVVAVTPALVLMLLTDWDAHVAALPLIGVIMGGIVAWLVAVVRMNHPLCGELQVFARRIPGLRRFSFAA